LLNAFSQNREYFRNYHDIYRKTDCDNFTANLLKS
jgi:hypothetical protein